MNWGTKLTIGMILFMAFIVTLVILMIKPHKADSLIENDYYEKGQTFDHDYNAIHDAIRDSILPVIGVDEKGLSTIFPRAVKYKMVLRNLADAGMDTIIQSNIEKEEVFIPKNELKPGAWLLRIEYKVRENDYLYQNKIRIP